ncbi:MAG: hypothetical protein AAF810_24650 [Cyanobacteria bacterium P01_D01_bin.36]
MLTIRGTHLDKQSDRQKEKKRDEQTILDGRLYSRQMMEHSATENWLIENLDWQNLLKTRLLLENIILLVCAIAAQQNVKTISWTISYPTHLSRNQRNLCTKTWQDLTEKAAAFTGLTHRCESNPNASHFVPNSIAIGKYWQHTTQVDKHHSSLEPVICLHLGAQITDITFWQNQQLIHQCTLDFSIESLLTQHLQANPASLYSCFGLDVEDWHPLESKHFHRQLSLFMQWNGSYHLKKQQKNSPNADSIHALMQLLALGFSGLYYYVGLTLNVLKRNNTYKHNHIPTVYVGGRSSAYIHWLSSSGRFTNQDKISLLLSHMLSRGAAIAKPGSHTRLSQHPHAEVAYGLVCDKIAIAELNEKGPKLLVPGETFSINHLPYRWDHPTLPTETVRQLTVPTLEKAPKFLHDFQAALDTLSIENIPPLKGYVPSLKVAVNLNLWQSVQQSIKTMSKPVIAKPSTLRTSPPFILVLKALLQQF